MTMRELELAATLEDVLTDARQALNQLLRSRADIASVTHAVERIVNSASAALAPLKPVAQQGRP